MEKSLKDEMQQLSESHVPAPYVPHKTETADELYELVTAAMREEARAGCRNLNFHWGYLSSSSQEEYDKYRQIIVEVVSRLRAEKLAVSTIKPEDDKWSVGMVSHYEINVDWSPGESLTSWKQREELGLLT